MEFLKRNTFHFPTDPSGVSFACHALAYALAITTANFDRIEVKHQKLWCAKAVGSMHLSNGNLYSDFYQILSSILLLFTRYNRSVCSVCGADVEF